MHVHALLDSNIAYQASAGRLTGRTTLDVWACAGSVIELGSKITDAATLAETQRRLSRLLSLVDDRILPDPDTLLVWYMDTALPKDVVTYWATLARTIAAAQTYADVEDTAELLRAARAAQRALFEEGVRDIIRRVNPNADFANWNVKLPEKQADEFRARLWSPDALRDFVASFLLRRTPAPSDAAIRAAIPFLEPTYRVYRGMLDTVIRNGEKLRVNDGIDLMLALPLWQQDWIVVTDDARLRGFAARGEVPVGRFRALSELL